MCKHDGYGSLRRSRSLILLLRSIFIDQPVGVGFSYGTLSVGTSQQAAADIWTVRALLVAIGLLLTVWLVLPNMVFGLEV
jgi:hypothetical protein